MVLPRGGGLVAIALVAACGTKAAETLTCGLRDDVNPASPFPDDEAETLVINTTNALSAASDVYSRVASDLPRIRTQFPVVSGIKVRQRNWDMLIGMETPGMTQVEAGTYSAWNCPNGHFGMSDFSAESAFTGGYHITVRFGGRRLNTELVAEEYKGLPYVEYAQSNLVVGDGDTVCLSIAGATYHYVFRRGLGDCPAGCTQTILWGFSTVSATSPIVERGTWDSENGPLPAELEHLKCSRRG